MTKCVASYSQTRISKAVAIGISHLYCSKTCFSRCPPLVRKGGALALKVGVPCRWKITKCVTSYYIVAKDNLVALH